MTDQTSGTVQNAFGYVVQGNSQRSLGPMPISTVIQTSPDYYRVRPFRVDEFSTQFRDPRLPHKIRIDRDPFDTDFSIWFLVVDLRELVTLYIRIFAPNDLSKRYRRNGRINRMRSAILGKDDRTASQFHNANLFTQFGLLPTIRDFQEFFTLLAKWKERYDQAKELFRRKHNYHLPVVDVPWLNLFTRTYTGLRGYAPEQHFDLTAEVSTSVSARFNRTLQYHYTAPEFQGWMSRIAQFIDAFGLLDPAAIWDVIPFSFVLDWFVKIGAWLHNNRPRLFPAGYHVLDYCESIKRQDTVNWRMIWTEPVLLFNPDGPPTQSLAREGPVMREIFTSYDRRKYSPSVESFDIQLTPEKSKRFVSLRRVSIASSLLAQRLPR
jgi:hypothetical protein